MELCNFEQCTGCMACYNACNQNAITTVIDRKGFMHPSINNDKCIGCGRCAKVCPVLSPVDRCTENEVYAGWIKDNKTRHCSSSGGLFSALSKFCIENGGVVFGAKYAEDYKSVLHGVVENERDLSLLMTSKYVQSAINESFKRCRQYLLENRYVLFSGTPCQIAGLKAFLNKEYDKLLTVDIVCHGVPSTAIYKDYMMYLENQK